jgi:hypothetical protein
MADIFHKIIYFSPLVMRHDSGSVDIANFGAINFINGNEERILSAVMDQMTQFISLAFAHAELMAIALGVTSLNN